MSSFAEATALEPVDAYTYSAHFPEDWCIGTVPHGGFVTSVFLQVAKAHFSTTLSSRNQPHSTTCHLEFLRRTQIGPATFKVRHVKLGRQFSVIHVTLFQDGRHEVEGYITQSNLYSESGVSFPTPWKPYPSPTPVSSLARLKEGKDENWAEVTDMPFAEFRKASKRVRFHLPRKGQMANGMADEWLRMRSGERFTHESLGFVADMGPQLVEGYLADEDLNDSTSPVKARKGPAKFWYPTLLLNLDVKKALPDEGVEWLFVRIQAKKIANGRMDLEFLVLDEEGDLVAVSNHVALVVGAERNLAARRKEESKL